MKLDFSDGISIDTSGELRLLFIRNDGWYVVGKGMLIPVDNQEEGNEVIKDLTK